VVAYSIVKQIIVFFLKYCCLTIYQVEHYNKIVMKVVRRSGEYKW